MAYVTRKFIAVVTNVRHWDLSWARSSQFSSQTPTSRRSLLILSSQSRFGLLKGIFPSGFPTKMEYNHCFSPIRAIWPAHLSHREFIILTTSGESYSPWSSLLYSLLHSPVISSRFVPYIFLKTLCSNIRNLCSSVRVVLQLSQP